MGTNAENVFANYIPPPELVPSDPRFGSGPSRINSHHIESLHATGPHLLGTSHRRDAVKNLVGSIQESLIDYLRIPNDYAVVLGNGGASFLFDALGLVAVESKSKHFTCGEFSSKWWKSHNLVPWIEAKNVEMTENNLQVIEEEDAVCITLNETSTGIMIPDLPRVDNALLYIDATSGAGQIYCDLQKVDIFFFSLQKIFASDGGSFVAIISPKAQERIKSLSKDQGRYVPAIMNLHEHIQHSRKLQTYNTPSIATLFLFYQQLVYMQSIGYDKIVAEALTRAKTVYDWANSKPYLNPYVENHRMRSSTVATIDVNSAVNVNLLLARLHELQIVYGIESYRKLNRNQFRLSLFYNISFDDIKKLLDLLSHAIESSKLC